MVLGIWLIFGILMAIPALSIGSMIKDKCHPVVIGISITAVIAFYIYIIIRICKIAIQ